MKKPECDLIVPVRVQITKLANRAIIVVEPVGRQFGDQHQARIKQACSMIIKSNKQQPVACILESLCTVTATPLCVEIQIVFTPINGRDWSSTFSALANRSVDALKHLKLRIAPGLKYTKNKNHKILHSPRQTA